LGLVNERGAQVGRYQLNLQTHDWPITSNNHQLKWTNVSAKRSGGEQVIAK